MAGLETRISSASSDAMFHSLSLTDWKETVSNSEIRDERAETILSSEWLCPTLEEDSQEVLQSRLRASLQGKKTFVVRVLLDNGQVDINHCSKTEAPPLHIAFQHDFREGMEMLLNDHRIDINKRNPLQDNISILEVAVKEWNIMLAEALLARDDLDVKHCHKLLFEVSRRTAELPQSPERNEMLALFLKSGRFDLNEANECGLNTFVMYLVDFQDKSLMDTFISSVEIEISGEELFDFDDVDKRIHLLEKMIRLGICNTSRVDAEGRNLLHHACARGETEVCALLVQLMDIHNINKSDHRHNSPFLVACSAGQTQVVKYLTTQSDSILVSKRAMFRAVHSGEPEVVDLLLSHPTARRDVNIVTKNTQRSPLHVAVLQGKVEALRSLLNYSSNGEDNGYPAVDVMCRDANGKLAFDYACELFYDGRDHGREVLSEFLLAKPALYFPFPEELVEPTNDELILLLEECNRYDFEDQINALRLRGLLSSESIEEYQPLLAKAFPKSIGMRYGECLSQIILSFLKKPPMGHCVAILATYEAANVAQDDLEELYGELLSKQDFLCEEVFEKIIGDPHHRKALHDAWMRGDFYEDEMEDLAPPVMTMMPRTFAYVNATSSTSWAVGGDALPDISPSFNRSSSGSAG